MSEHVRIGGLPFACEPSPAELWVVDAEAGVVGVSARGHTDLYVNPAGDGSTDAESLLNAATLLGLPPEGDFRFAARTRVDFESTFDAGVLLIWQDSTTWAKLCFEYSPAGEPMVVSVVTKGVSDDANSFVVERDVVWLRVSRVDQIYAFHASTDGRDWRLVRVFTLGPETGRHRLGFEAQSPTGSGVFVRFDELRFSTDRLLDLRDGS